jgi:hypothetical protein
MLAAPAALAQSGKADSPRDDNPAAGKKAAPVTTDDATALMPRQDTTPPPRVAITEFLVEGEEVPPALVYQLQDGFVLGLVRSGSKVIDHEEVPKRLKGYPELVSCDTSVCLKKQGEMLRVGHVVKVAVSIVGNSYKMTARVFRTTGTAPATLPIETQSRFCDVCTVTEAREAMLRLADGVRVPDEPGLADEIAPIIVMQTPPPPGPSVQRSSMTMALGITAVVVGSLVLSASGEREKGAHALAGAAMGIGLTGSVVGLYQLTEAWQTRSSRGSVEVADRR